MARGRTTGIRSDRSELGRPRARAWARPAAGALLAGAALAAWQGTLTRQSSVTHWTVAAVIALAVVAAVAGGTGRHGLATRAWLGAAVRSVAGWRARRPMEVAGVASWVVLIAAVVGWDLNSFAHQSHDLPTLSHFIGLVTAVPAGRGLLFAAWLGLGAYLALGRRRAR